MLLVDMQQSAGRPYFPSLCVMGLSLGPGSGSRGTAMEAFPATKEPTSSSPALSAHSALCGAGGGAHVGSGGAGVHAQTGRPCLGSGGVAYDGGPPIVLSMHPVASHVASVLGAGAFASTASASGGGGDLTRAGSGGGIVWVQGRTVIVEGVILADGGGGELMQDAIIDVELSAKTCNPVNSSRGSPTGLKEGAEQTAEEPRAADPYTVNPSSPIDDSGETHTHASVAGRRDLSPTPAGKSDTIAVAPDARDSEIGDGEKLGGDDDPGASVSCQLSGILSDPAQLGQGGGAGGSVVVEAGSLKGKGLISAQGGHGGRCTGGGGGGGAINFLWDPSLHSIRSQQDPAQQQKFKDSSSNSSKDGAGAGRSAAEGSSGVFIPWLRPLDFAAGFSGSLRVGGGGSDPSAACGPLQLPLGLVGAPGELLNPLGCLPGYVGWRCSPCPVGFYSDEQGRVCVSCSNKPSSNAFYTQEGVGNPHCPYACVAGLPDASVNPKCLPPLLFILEKLLCWAALIPIGVSFVVLLGLAVLIREVPCGRRQQGWGSLWGVSGLLAPASVRGLVERERDEGPCSLFGAAQPSPSGSLGFLMSSKESRLQHLAVRHLTFEDLPFHVLRIYLHGRNSPHSPWGLDGQPPPFLDPLIIPHRFTTFAAAVNDLCSFGPWFVCIHRALSYFYPPLAALLLRGARARRANRLVTLCSTLAEGGSQSGGEGDGPCSRGSWESWGRLIWWRRSRLIGNPHHFVSLRGSGASASFWRSIRARELSFALKFGCDPDCTLGFIDVLDLDRNILDYRCSPQLPLVLLTQGDGRIVPFSLSRGFRDLGIPPAAQEAKDSPADPLQGSLEEFAPPLVWACLSAFFTAKVKEITAEELATLRTLVTTTRPQAVWGDAGEGSRGHQGTGGWMGSLLMVDPFQEGPARSRGTPCGFYRCGRCGRPQLPSKGSEHLGRRGPLRTLMGDPLYAVRAIARLCEGVRLMSDRLLKPHGISASVCLMTSQGFVSRSIGVRRVTGALPGALLGVRSSSDLHRLWGHPSATDETGEGTGKPVSSIGQKVCSSVRAGASARHGPLGTGHMLLRAASSPSALLDSLRGNHSKDAPSSLPPDTNEALYDTKGAAGTFSGLEASGGALTGRPGSERGAPAISPDAKVLGAARETMSSRSLSCPDEAAKLETDAILALVITEEALESDGEGPPATASGTRNGIPPGASTSQALTVPCFPPVSSLAVTSPLDPNRLSPFNKPLSPYTAAATPALHKSIPSWGSGYTGGAPLPQYTCASGGLPSSRQSFDKPASQSPKQKGTNGFRGLRKIRSPFTELSPPTSQGPGCFLARPKGIPTEPIYSSQDVPVMCLAEAAKRSAGADAQHLRNAVEALQKKALEKLGKEPSSGDMAETPDGSAGYSRITTMGTGEAEGAKTELDTGDNGVSPEPERAPHSLALLQLGWRRLRFRSAPTDLARQASPQFPAAFASQAYLGEQLAFTCFTICQLLHACVFPEGLKKSGASEKNVEKEPAT